MRNWESEKVGKSFLNRLDEVVLTVGRDTFTRREMVAHLKCGNFAAAARLDWALRRFEPRGIRELSRRVDIADLFHIKGVGEATVYVWLCLLDYTKVNPVEWLDSEVKIPTLYANRKKRKRRA